MALALLKLKGWYKEVELTQRMWRTGMVEYSIEHPLDMLLPMNENTPKKDIEAVHVKFFHCGLNKDNMPIFEAR